MDLWKFFLIFIQTNYFAVLKILDFLLFLVEDLSVKQKSSL